MPDVPLEPNDILLHPRLSREESFDGNDPASARLWHGCIHNSHLRRGYSVEDSLMGKEIEHLPALAEPNLRHIFSRSSLRLLNRKREASALALFLDHPAAVLEIRAVLSRRVWSLTFVISARLQPIYESVATISIDRNAPADRGRRSPEAGWRITGCGSIYCDADEDGAIRRRASSRCRKFDLLEREHQLRGLSPQMTRALRDAPTQLRQLRVSRPTNTYLVQVSYRSPSRATCGRCRERNCAFVSRAHLSHPDCILNQRIRVHGETDR